MDMDEELFEHLCRLARIRPDPEEHRLLEENLLDIVQMIDIIGQAPTEGVLPLPNPGRENQRLRPDMPVESEGQECLQAMAPEFVAGYYLVPRVMDS